MHPSIANLSSRLHLCSGEVPPPLVGASATLVESSDHLAGKGAQLYLFGGRLVSSRRMVNTLYCLDLGQMRWSRLTPPTLSRFGDAQQPQPRYFHSADLWRDKIVFFGGMGYSNRTGESSSSNTSSEPKPDELCVLDEVLVFDLTQQMWDHSFDLSADVSDSTADPLRPAPRYAHLSSLSGDTLAIIGGQTLANQYVESINVFNLNTQSWIGSHRFRKQCGSYRSLSVGTQHLFQQGEKAKCYPRGRDPLYDTNGQHEHSEGTTPTSAKQQVEQNPLPMTVLPKPDASLPIYLYSNYNFTDVRRELEVLTVRPSAASARPRSVSDVSQDSALDVDLHLGPSQRSEATPLVSTEDRSKDMGGVTLPPGLRFPTGALLGPYLLISGTYLANATQTFSIWALHLPTMVWSRIEAGSALSTGSWNRAILWPSKNRLIIVGHKERDLVSDYNHRQTNWDHVVVLELEAWGVYRPPISMLSEPAVQIGLDKLAASAPSALVSSDAKPESDEASHVRSQPSHFSETLGGRGDFEIVCSDGLRIGCDRVILECRWPWFRSKMDDFRRRARRTLRVAFPANAADQFGLGMISEDISDIFEVDEDDDEEAIDPLMTSSRTTPEFGKQSLKDPRFQPRHLQISEPSPVVLAFLQFLYSSRISTALQRHPAVVCALMVLAKTYDMEDLAIWSRHAAHVALADDLHPKTTAAGSRNSESLAPSSPMNDAMEGSNVGLQLFKPAESLGLHPEERHRLAVCLYEAASLCGCEGLQIRALRVVMAIARWLQKHGSHSPSTGGAGPGSESAGNGEGDRISSRASMAPNYAQQGGSNAQPQPNSTSKGAGGQTRSSHAMFQQMRMPSPVLTMSRSGSEAASSQGPLTPTSMHQSFLDRRNSSLSSAEGGNGGGGSQAFSNGQDSYDTDDGANYRWHARPPGSSHKKAEHTMTLAPYYPTNDVLESEAEAFSDNDVAHTGIVDSTYSMAPLRRSNQDLLSLSETQMRLESFNLQEQASTLQYARRSLPLSPRSSIDASHKRSQVNAAQGEQYRVNAYGPQAGPTQRSVSMQSPSSASSPGQQAALSQDRQLESRASVQSHLSDKEITKLDKERKRQQAKEDKLRKKAEKAEYKRLAADAVFGPKGSIAPSSASASDFAAFSNGGTGISSRRESEVSDTRSGSGRSGGRTSSFSTGPRSFVSVAPIAKAGEWSVTTAATASPWFSGPPPPMQRRVVPRSGSLS